MYSLKKHEKEHNEALIKEWQERDSARDYLWASDIGKSHFDVYHKMIGTKADNPITIDGLHKMKSGELYEEAYLNSLQKQGIGLEQQVRIELPETDTHLKVTGKIDAVLKVETLGVPLEVKSVNSRAFWYVERQNKGNWYQGFYIPYHLQLYTYITAKSAKYGILLFISRDDTTTAQIYVQKGKSSLSEAWEKWMTDMATYYREKKEPPKPPLYVEGKKYNRSTRKYDTVMEVNKQLEFSSFRERIVGCSWDEFLEKSKEELKKLNT